MEQNKKGKTMNKKTLDAVQSALMILWEKAHEQAHKSEDVYTRGWLFGFAQAITRVQCALSTCDTQPLDDGSIEIEGMK